MSGARQIGKTYLIKEFAKNEYDYCVAIDFIEEPELKDRFLAAESADEVIDLLAIKLGHTLVPGKTLVFLDEVQMVPEVVTFSKYLVLDGRFDLIMSGSMLGTELSGIKSMPVGYLSILDMYPLTFEEFCWASHVPDSVLATIDECFEEHKPLPEGMHAAMIEVFRRYLIVGGMPEVVQECVVGARDLGATRQVQEGLVRLYREDISKYARPRALRVKAIFDALPSQLNKENKRFQMRAAHGSSAKYERYANDYAWLVAACAALKVDNVTDPRPMLKRTAEKNKFKLYASDTGMLFAMYPSQTAMAALLGEKAVNFGSVYENYVAQELAAAGDSLFYYHNNRKGEVDFLVELATGGVLPIEVKSGKDYKLHVALNNLLESAEYDIPEAVVLSEANVSVGERAGKPVYYLPLYMAGKVAALGDSPDAVAKRLGKISFEPIRWEDLV